MPKAKTTTNLFTLSFSTGGDPYAGDPFYGGGSGARTYSARGETLDEAISGVRSQIEAKLSKNSDKAVQELLA